MNTKKNKKEKIKNLIVLFSLIFSLIFVNFGMILPQNWNINDLNDFDPINEDNKYQFEEIPTSSQALNYSGSGENINISLHQSLIDTTVKEFNDLDVSNSFTEPFPNFLGYNTSLVNISINNINAPNKTLNLELGTTSSDQILTDLFAYSFRVRTTCLIQNLSIYLSESGGSGGNVDIKVLIFNATYDTGDSRIEPDTNTGLIDITQTVPNEDTGQWYNFTINKNLDVSNTYNNTFFIYFYQNTNINFARGYYHYESGSTSDGYLTYRDSGAGWQAIARDISSQIIVGLNDNTPIPSDINLKINGTAVNDIESTNAGYWTSTEEYKGHNGNLDFEVTADWWEVSCNITNVQINYTKTDLKASSDFYITDSGQNVQWNVTIPSGLNYFDSRITDFNTINFTIPDTWSESSIQVFNGATNKTSDLVKKFLGNGYREVQVLDASNGTFWHLNATSTNLLTNIVASLGSIPQSSYNHSDTINFTAQFISYISNGNLNLSVFTPITSILNFTSIKDLSFETPGVVFFIENWQISSTLKSSEYGSYVVQMAWNNDSAAGFFEITIDIFAETELLWDIPKTTFDSDEIFNIDVFFNDTGINAGIDADSFTYSILGKAPRTDNITINGNGNYTISIACDDPEFEGFGDKQIQIYANKTYHNNQSEIIDVRILGLSEMVDFSLIDGKTYNSSENFIITVFYNDTVRDLGINGAKVEYSIEGNTYRSDGVNDLTTGNYTITISASDDQFGGYGVKDIDVRTNKDFYYNHSQLMSIKILGETSLTTIKVPDQSNYNASDIILIRLYYNDTVKDLPLDGATVSYEIEGNSLRTDSVNTTSIGPGYYDISIDCNDTDFNGYGLKSVNVYIERPFHYNQSQLVNFFILGETDLTTSKIPDRASYNASESLLVRIFFDDIVKNVPVDGATISYEIEASGIRTDNIDTTSIGPGYYDISIDCNDTDFNGYGVKTITVYANKDYYNNQSRVVSLRILGETSLYVSLIPARYDFNASELFTINMYFNDTVKDLPINGATVSYEIEGNGLPIDSITYLGSGFYEIEIYCNDTDFNGYGWKSITVFIELDAYHNQSQVINIRIFGETSLSLEKDPDQAYYDSSETMVLRLYFNDTIKNFGIFGGTLTYQIVSGPLRSDNVVDLLNGFYEITIDCNDTDFNGYGSKTIFIYLNKHYYNNQSTQTNLIVVGFTELRILSPDNLTAYYSGQAFNITIEYYDTIKDVGVTGATISYLLPTSGSPRSDNVVEIGNGIYRIEISVNDGEFDAFGYVDVDIQINQVYFLNRSNTFTFHRQITTVITPDPPGNIIDLGSVLRGLNITCTFNYSDTSGSPVLNANYSLIGSNYAFLFYLQENGNGNYTFHFDTTFVDVSGSPFTLSFNVTAYGKQIQILQITIDVLIIYTDIVNPTWDSEIARNLNLNQTFTFYFNDTVNNLPVLDLTTTNIVIRHEGTGLKWNTGDFNWMLINPLNDGNYILHISLNGLDSGWYSISVNASYFPNYDESIFYFNFYLRGNYTDIDIDYFSDVGGKGVLTPTGQNYSIFVERDLYVNFTIIDLEFGNQLVIGTDTAILVQFYEIGNLSNNGTLSHNITYDANTYSYKGYIHTSAFALPLNYIINITINKLNYENSTHSINLFLKAKYITDITTLLSPSEVSAGDSFIIHFQVSYQNGSIWMPLIGTSITLIPSFDGIASTPLSGITNATGGISFEITIGRRANNISLTVQLVSGYYYTSAQKTISDIEVIPLPPGFSWMDLLPYLIIIGVAVGAVGISVGVYRGVVVPRKREKQRILNEVKTIFDDAINLEHILVLYKGTGTCIYFKSYGSEVIDPELIGGFLSAVSSFGKEMVAQEALNEISYGDKMLLLADGVFIRVALVLGKKGSLILRRNLKRFIESFENTYKDILPKWRGQLNHFMNAGQIVDDLLNTSIILPHQISYDFSSIKDLKIAHSKDVLKVAHNCCEESDRKFFFIATLLKEAAESTNKDTAEIFMGIKELRDKRMLIPIEISAIEAQPISQQEINLISQKVSQLTSLTNEEKQKMVSDLSQVGPVEREAYLASFSSHQEIISAPIKSKVGTTVIEDKKTARKQLKILTKAATNLKRKKDFPKSIETYRRAVVIASNWELSNEFIELEEDIRKTTIEDLQHQKKIKQLEAKDALKKKDYAISAIKFKEASKIASEIFKLGVTDMMKEVKRLTNKANELDKKK